jgi:hypothetical protein
MNRLSTLAGVALALSAVSTASAQDNERALERLEVTMTLLPEQARDASEITRRIELPPAAERRRDDAGDADRPTGPPEAAQRGLDTAAEARERGRDFGQQVAEEARQNRENAGRRDDTPTGPPAELPGPPAELPRPPSELPGPPVNPGRP